MSSRTRQGRGPAPVRARRPLPGRTNALLALLVVLLTVVGVRLAWLQVVEAGALTRTAEKQRMRDIKLPARRGAIFDREGQPLAVTSDAKTVYADPREVEDATATADAVAHALGGAAADYLPKLTKNTSFVYLARKVSLQRAAALSSLELKGIVIVDDSMRTYPGGELACQLLGFVNVDDKGWAGLEMEYDSTLSGTPGRVVAERDTQGHIIPGGVITTEDAVDGQDIYLTIDKDIQFKSQAELAKAVKKYGAKSGSVIVMDPRNGEVLAMASTPFFDPNDYRSASQDAMRNKAVSDTYEPGSTIKSFTAAAAIDTGLYTPTSMFHLPPTLKVGDRIIHESHPRGTVDWSLTQIVTESSNVGAVMIGQKLGKARILEYFSRFGLAHRTGIDFPGEARGLLPSASQWSASTIGNVPFGQGLSVTPIQLVRAMAAIANGGTMVTPHLLYRQSSAVVTFPPDPVKVISAQTASSTTVMLTDVVREGTGVAAKVAGFEVAGKTGTASKVVNGRYARGVYVSSFVGYLPAGRPQLLILVVLDSPRSGLFGGTVAAPAFHEIASFCIAHLRIPPAPTVGDFLTPSTESSRTAGNEKVSGAAKAASRTVESTSSNQ